MYKVVAGFDSATRVTKFSQERLSSSVSRDIQQLTTGPPPRCSETGAKPWEIEQYASTIKEQNYLELCVALLTIAGLKGPDFLMKHLYPTKASWISFKWEEMPQ